jgi:translocation and assembly module TamB
MRRRKLAWAAAAAAGLTLALGALVVTLTMTNFGRERVGRIALGRLAERINGRVVVSAVRGNLLTGATLIDLRITDPDGRLFLSADTLRLRYGMRALFRKRLEFSDVHFGHPVVVLDQPPGQPWNYQRIFPADTVVAPGDTVPGFGSWVNLVDVTISGGTIELRREWTPPAGGGGRAPDPSELAFPESRFRVVPAHGGLQAVSLFHHVDARLPRLRFAHPDTAVRLVEIDDLRMLALPFQPPGLHVLGGSGRVTSWEDTIAFEDLELSLPGTRLDLDGFFAFGDPSGMELRLSGDPLATESLRWLRPSLPEGSGRLDLRFVQDAQTTRAELSDMDLVVEGATIEGSATVSLVNDALEIDESDVRFTNVDTRLVERTVEELDVPIDGLLTGDVRLAGSPDDLDVAGWIEVSERSGATSRVEADGHLASRGGELVARELDLRLEPLRLTLVGEVAPELPLTGTLAGRATLDGPLQDLFQVDADLVHSDPRAGRSHVLAEGEVRVVGGIVAKALALRFDPLQAEAVRAFAPEFPLEGTIEGRAVLTGTAERGFDVNADVAHDSPDTGRSHVVAVGDVLLGRGPPRLAGMRVRLDPLQAAVLRVFDPDLPLDGTITGEATLDGSPQALLASDVTLIHRGSTGVSEIQGTVAVEEDEGAQGFEVDVAVSPLSLATVGRFAPAAELRGLAAGRIRLRGTSESAAVDVSLDVTGGGSLVARGTAGVGEYARYDLRTTLTRFDASAVSALAPPTALSGAVDLAGVGTDARTADARIDARLVDSALEGTPRLDSTRVRARLADGQAFVDEGRVRLASASADLEGSFGIVPEREGSLAYTVAILDLSEFSHLLPDSFRVADSGAALERPLPRERRMAQARADSSRAAMDRLVASAATGRALPGALPLDTAPPLPRDSIAGSVRAEGVVEGNVRRFAARGTAELEDVVLRGSAAGSGHLTFAFTDPRAEPGAAELDLRAQNVRVQGFAFDSVGVRLDHEGRLELGSGHLEVEAFQDPARDYSLVADYTLAADAKALFLERLALRFDTTRWASVQPGVVRWSGDLVQLEHIELVNDYGGRIFADGAVPDGGSGDLTVRVQSFQIGDVAALLQDTLDTRGLLDLDARITGTLRAPNIEGDFAVDSLQRAGVPLPALSGDFRYAGEELTAQAELRDAERLMLSADARLPVNLALRGVVGTRLLDRPMSIELVIDSLPLETLPEISSSVQALRGRAFGTVAIGGTPNEPAMSGQLTLSGASATLPDAGITLTQGAGSFTFRDDRIAVDSLVALSGEGDLRVSGTIDVETITNPVFDLDVRANSATVLRNKRGDDVQADLALEVTGPLEALRITGEILVEEGVITVPEPENLRRATDLDDPALVGVYDALSVPPELRPHASFLRHADVDVAVRIQRDTWVRNSDLHVEIYTPDLGTPLRVASSAETGSLVLEGVVFTDRGEYTVAGRNVELTTGSITFMGLPQPDPLLQLNAQHEVPRPGRQALIILVNVSGYLSQPRVSLSSNAQPPLTESDLLSYLAFGRESSSLLAQQGSGIMGDALGSVGIIAGQQLWGLGLGALTDAVFTTAERQGQEAGFDVFRVSAATLPDELNFGAVWQNTARSIEVEAGEYVLRSRLFLATRVRPSAGTIPGLWAEYRTPSGFIWRATWETRFFPMPPTLGLQTAGRARVFGTFFLWNRRF